MPPGKSNSADDSTNPVRVECRYDEDTPPSIGIVRVIAVIEDIDPMDSPTALGMTLYDHVDPVALDQLLSATSDVTGVIVNLTFHNGHQYAVQIRDDGHLVVEKPT